MFHTLLQSASWVVKTCLQSAIRIWRSSHHWHVPVMGYWRWLQNKWAKSTPLWRMATSLAVLAVLCKWRFLGAFEILCLCACDEFRVQECQVRMWSLGRQHHYPRMTMQVKHSATQNVTRALVYAIVKVAWLIRFSLYWTTLIWLSYISLFSQGDCWDWGCFCLLVILALGRVKEISLLMDRHWEVCG